MWCCKQNLFRSLPLVSHVWTTICTVFTFMTKYCPLARNTWPILLGFSKRQPLQQLWCTFPSWQRCSGIHSMCNLQLGIPVASNKKNEMFSWKWHDKEKQEKRRMSQHLPLLFSFDSATSSLPFLLCLSCAKDEIWSKTQNYSNKSTYKYQGVAGLVIPGWLICVVFFCKWCLACN